MKHLGNSHLKTSFLFTLFHWLGPSWIERCVLLHYTLYLSFAMVKASSSQALQRPAGKMKRPAASVMKKPAAAKPATKGKAKPAAAVLPS